MADIFARLAAPFPPDKISWRVGTVTKDKTKAQALAYLDSRDVQIRLDEVVGPARWQCRYTQADPSSITYGPAGKSPRDRDQKIILSETAGKTICEIGIKTDDGEWIWKADGAGDTDVESEKGAVSDAFKRAAVKFGIGRYLYEVPTVWVKINQFKQIEPSELPKLQRALPGSRVATDDDAAPPTASPPTSRPTASAQAPKTDGADPHVEEDRKAFAAAKTALKQGKDKEWIEGVMNDPAIDALKSRRPDAYATLALLADQQIEAINTRHTGI